MEEGALDPRHQSHHQHICCQIIELINHMIVQQVDSILHSDILLADMQAIATQIYKQRSQWVDVEHVLSKKNLLSVDVVALPPINETTLSDECMLMLFANLTEIAYKKNEGYFYQELRKILNNEPSPVTK